MLPLSQNPQDPPAVWALGPVRESLLPDRVGCRVQSTFASTGLFPSSLARVNTCAWFPVEATGHLREALHTAKHQVCHLFSSEFSLLSAPFRSQDICVSAVVEEVPGNQSPPSGSPCRGRKPGPPRHSPGARNWVSRDSEQGTSSQTPSPHPCHLSHRKQGILTSCALSAQATPSQP